MVGLTSRELRVWPQEKLLIVMNITCGPFYGARGESERRPNIRFYDIAGPNAAEPQVVSTYRPPVEPHEMFLRIDPRDPARAFLFISVFSGSVGDVVDIRNGLYILQYTGPGSRAVRDVAFLEGNSNRGDALRIEQG